MKQTIILGALFIISCSERSANDKDSIREDNTKDKILIEDTIHVEKRFYEDLSNNYNFKIGYTQQLKNSKTADNYWTIEIFDKNKNKVDSIVQTTYELSLKSLDFKQVRSYSTGKNLDKSVVDNYFGELVIADFNFDSKEDFAIINDEGGNAGVFYSYYIQQANKKFVLDRYLSDSMVYFPSAITKESRTLVRTTNTTCCFTESTYQLTKGNQWEKTHYKEILH